MDDCLTFSKDDSTIDKLIQSFSKTFLLQDEGDFSTFLGVQITRDTSNKSLHLTQLGLIEQVIKDVGMDKYSKEKDTPINLILYPDLDRPDHIDSRNYRSIIGKLNYIANNTQPDISMAVHQCAHYCTNPKALHELVVKRIVHYLLATKDKGLILKSISKLSLDMFVDADFAGWWHREYAELRDSILSCTGYITTFCGYQLPGVVNNKQKLLYLQQKANISLFQQ